MKLAIAQMVLGALIVANWLSLGLPWPMPGFWSMIKLWPNNFLWIIWEPFWIISLVLGLVVLGCGSAQFLKARKARSKDEHF